MVCSEAYREIGKCEMTAFYSLLKDSFDSSWNEIITHWWVEVVEFFF